MVGSSYLRPIKSRYGRYFFKDQCETAKCGKVALMSPSPAFANAPFTFEEMIARRAAEQRETLARYQAPKDVEVEEAKVGIVPIRIYRPAQNGSDLPLLLWMHGGAFIGGGLDMPEAQVTAFEIAHRAKSVVVSIDYRLCNDAIRFPLPQQDCVAIADWVLINAEQLGFDPTRFFIGGGSAGACLAGSVALLMRDRGVKVAGVIPVYAVGHREELPPTRELQSYVDEFFGKPQGLLLGHNEWLDPNPSDSAVFYPWPAEAENFAGLAKHYFIHADFDILRSTGEPWAAKLRDSGIEVHEEVLKGSKHGFLNDLPTENPLQSEALDRISLIIKGK
jgi:acetyl esterase/lipase